MVDVKYRQSGYIPGIDGLRAIAVLSVIIFHLDASILPGGFSGVDVFFVISGYVVSSSLAKENQVDFLRFTVAFYARRIVRIYPALVACILIVGLLQTLLVPASWLSTTANKTAMFAFFGLSNFALIWFDDGYFSPRVEFNPFTHTWSLAVEEQFYLLFPLVFYLWLKGREKAGFAGLFSRWTLAILLGASLLYSWLETGTRPDRAYYLLPSRFWELACGAALFTMHARHKLVTESSRIASACLAVGLILISSGFSFSDPKSFPFPWAVLSVLGSIFVIIGVVSHPRRKGSIGQVVDNRLMVYIGKISYSLYLWHWPVFVLFRWTVGLQGWVAPICALILTALISALSFHFVEKPIRQNRSITTRTNWQIVSRGAMVIAFSALVSGSVFMAQPYLTLSVTKDRMTWYPNRWPSVTDKSLLPPRLQGRRIFVFGDSHSSAYSTLLQKLGDEQGVEVHLYSKGGCAIANFLMAATPDCSEFIRLSVASILEIAAPGDIVFLASLRTNRLGDQWAIFNETDVIAQQLSRAAAAQRLSALREADTLIGNLEKASLLVVIDAPKPVFKSPPFRCSDWFNSSNPVCSGGFRIDRDYLVKHRKPVMESVLFLMNKHSNLWVWDTLPALCSFELCNAFDGKKPLFFDGDHLSAHGNRILYPSFLTMLTTIWLARRPLE